MRRRGGFARPLPSVGAVSPPDARRDRSPGARAAPGAPTLRFSYHYRLNFQNLYYDVAPDGDVYFADMAFTNKGYDSNLPAEQALQNQRSRAGAYWHSVTQGENQEFILGEVLMPGGATIFRAATGLVGPS